MYGYSAHGPISNWCLSLYIHWTFNSTTIHNCSIRLKHLTTFTSSCVLLYFFFLYAAVKTTAFKMSFVVQKCTRTKLTTVQQRGQNHQSKPRPSNSNKANRNQSTQVPSDCRKHTTQHYLILFCNLSQLRQYALLYLHTKVLYLN